MPVLNSLAGSTGIKLGPVMFETLLKHYFERVGGPSQDVVQLRKDEILYDEAFNVVKVCVGLLHGICIGTNASSCRHS
jgi:hypothetical protein